MQKKKPISSKEAEYLRKKKLVEGRKPNYFISIGVAKKIGKKADYSKNKGLDKEFYLEYIQKAIKQHGSMTRKEVDELLWKKLPELLNDKQKKNMIGNLLSKLRIENKIKNIGTRKESIWKLK